MSQTCSLKKGFEVDWFTLQALKTGDTWYETGTADEWKFTSYERDSESNNDYAIIRYESPRLGRFMSVDRLAGSVGNPQSLNRYAYVLNDPTNMVDPLGLVGTGGCGSDGGPVSCDASSGY